MLWDSSCGPFTRQTKNLAHRLIFLLGHHARLPMLIKQPKILAYIICPPGDRSGGQSITIYIRFIRRDKACTCTCMLGLIQY